MTESFTLGGDPAAIRASAQHWTSFGSSATDASSDLQGLDSGEFVGDEGETYRSRINADMQPHLVTTGSAWTSIAGGLQKYAGELEDLQQRMDTLRTQAGNQQNAVNDASSTLTSAKSADSTHTQQQQEATKALKPGETLPPSTYTSQTGSASTALSTARSDYHNTVAAARKVRDDHDAAVKACCGTIDEAKGQRFQKPPGFWDKVGTVASAGWDKVKAGVSWAAEHVGPILKVISLVAGVLALIPILSPIMLPIALVAGGAALALDVLNKLMNGEGSWLQIGLDTLGLIPGIKPLTTMGKLGKVAAVNKVAGRTGRELGAARSALRTAKNAGTGVKSAKKAVRAAETANRAAVDDAAALAAKYAKIDKVWKGIDLTTTSGVTTVTVMKTYRETGSWEKALAAGGISALGTKIPGTSKQAAAIQAIIANGGATGYQAYNLATNPELRNDPMQWAKLGAGGAKTVISGANAYAFSGAGTHPNGSSRGAFEVPNHWG